MLSVESIIAYSATNPIAANVLRINNTPLAGTGITGDSWRPA